MNKLQQINRYYAVSKSLTSMYMSIAPFDEDGLKLLELAQLFIDKAKTLKDEFDKENPDFDKEISDLEKAIKDNE